MVADHFHIDPGKVTALSADFHSQANTLGGQITAFGSKAENVNDAFGILAESTAALQQYVQMTQATVTSLQGLQAQLQGYSDGLAMTVKAYQRTDQHHARNMGAV